MDASTPPRGWNSWDCFGTTVTEDEVLANAEVLARELAPAGWDTVVVDIQWYEPVVQAGGYRSVSEPVLDAWGRQLPAPNRFPSAADGAGFAPLAERVHALGLRFGVHLMRGVPRRAVELDLPVVGADGPTGSTARDIAVPEDACAWNPDNVGVDLDHPAGQAWYDGVVGQLAAWGVDYLKVDDLLFPFHERDLAAVALAIRRSGRDIALSTSPGTRVSLARLPVLREHATAWRVSDDLWDRWEDVHEQFQRAARWAPHQQPGSWADLDMLPLGRIGIRAERGEDRQSRLTPDEQRTLVALWCFARSPLVLGGHLPDTPADVLELLRHPALLAVHARGDGRELVRDDDLVVWAADVAPEDADGPDDADAQGWRAVAVFWLGAEPSGPLRLLLADLGASGATAVSDAGDGRPVAVDQGQGGPAVVVEVPAHGVVLLRLDPDLDGGAGQASSAAS